ncbi:MAG: right-handed parallel beta-helix repeat-containing protein, partial [bacterium]
CFIDDSTGFVISDSGVIYKTTNQGTSWVQQATLPGVFTSICQAGTDTLYAGGNMIYRSADRGNTWNLVATLNDTVTQLGFFGSKTGFSIVPHKTYCVWAGQNYSVDSYYIAKTGDYGVTWQSASTIGERTNRMEFIHNSVAYFNGGDHVGYPHCMDGWYDVSKRTTNKGVTWLAASQPFPGRCAFSFINPDTGYFIRHGYYNNPPADKFKIWKTVDGASAFSQSYTELPDAAAKQIKFINEIDGYLLTNAYIYVTKSNGLAWQSDYASALTMNDLFYIPAHYLFCIGNNGQIVRKHIIESTHPDTIYRVKTDKTAFNFGMLPVSTPAVKQLQITNTGNISMNLTVTASDPFGVGLTTNSFSSSLPVTLSPLQDTTVFVRFLPATANNFIGSVVISADSLSNIVIPVTGSAFHGLSGNIAHDTLICTDTLRILGDVNVNHGAKLTICPGTYVKFLGNHALNVEGILRAPGTPQENITFGYGNSTAFWNGLHINNPVITDTTVLTWCNFPSRCNSPAINVSAGNVVMNHCLVNNLSGQGILLSGTTSRLLISNSEITGTATNAVACDSCYRLTMLGNHIHHNNTGIRFSGRKVLIENNEIAFNTARGIDFSSGDSCIIRRNRIYKNNGGIFSAGSYCLVENNEVFYNTDRGIYCEIGDKGSSILQNLVFNNVLWNHELYNGAGIFLTTKSKSAPTAYVISNTICNNAYITFGTDISAAGIDTAAFNMQVFNNIINNVASINYNVMWWPEVNATIDYNCINQTGLPGQHNLSADPVFKTPLTSLGILDNYEYNWSILGNSPCINTGDSTQPLFQLPLDFAGNLRVSGGRIDMGAYEYQGPFAIPENGSAAQVFVYPNPTDGMLNIVVDKPGPVELSLYDIAGNTILQKSFTRKFSADISNFATGIYFYELCDATGFFAAGKIIKE